MFIRGHISTIHRRVNLSKPTPDAGFEANTEKAKNSFTE